MKCKHCGTQFKGKFCPSCGAKYHKPTVILIICAIIVVGLIGGIIASTSLNNDIETVNGYIDSGDFDSAKEILDNQLKNNGSQSKLYITYADYYLARQDYLGAVDILEQGIKRCSSDDVLQEKLDDINDKYADEIAALKQAQQKAEKKAAEEATKKEQKRQAEETKQEQKSKKDYIAACTEIAYDDLARNPDKHKGQSFKFTGEVIQVAEPTFGNTVALRINVTKDEYDFYTDTIYATVTVPDGSDRILEDDIITVYGDCEGLYSYESVLGQKISLPKISIKYYEINK